jgi:Activator of aromatic catabolism/V4R domain
MKATDFDLSKDLKFDMETGITSFKDSRLVLFDANAIGLLRQSLIKEIGFEKARVFFLRFGYQHGYSDFLQMKINYEFDSEMDLLASGPVIHTWEGVVQATPKEIKFDRETGEFYFTGIWTNSYEAEQHLMYDDAVEEPVCWSLMGYASGWCTAFFGSPLLAIEPVCVGRGDDHCEWLIQPPDKFGDLAKPYMDALGSLMGGK